jgi:hypothetical protein
MNTARELPMLAGIAAVIRWFESLVLLLAGPLLTIGLGVAVVDLATNNALLNSVPWLLVAWGTCMAVGLDAQVIAAWDRVGLAFRERRWFVLVLYVVVGSALGYVGYIACAVFGFEHAMGYSEQQALGMMGVNATLYGRECDPLPVRASVSGSDPSRLKCAQSVPSAAEDAAR